MLLTEVNDLEETGFIILDTNLIIELHKISDLGVFTDFFNFLEETDLTPLITETIYIEFIRSSHTEAEKEAREVYLSNILNNEDPVSERNINDTVIHLGNIYSNKNIEGNPNLADCFVAANLVRYKENVVLATCDLEDYPTEVFDRVGLGVIYTEQEDKKISDQINKIGFYKYSEDKYSSCKQDFLKTG